MDESTAEIMESLEGLQEGLRVNGGELVPLEVPRDAETVALRLELAEDACLDCIVDGELLKRIVLGTLQEKHPWIQVLELDDPRVR